MAKQQQETSLVWSALGFMFGCLVMIFGITLHSQYKFGSSYNDALHIHLAAGIIIIAGAIVAGLGLAGMVNALYAQHRK